MFCQSLLAFLAIAALLVQTTPPSQEVVERERARWNEIFSKERPNIRTEANEFLVQVSRELKPGTALDIGIGTGRNALHLARQGWTVTGLDISDVAVKQATERARAEKLALTVVLEDMFKYEYGKDKYDLVVLMYMGGEERGMAEHITNTLKPGGYLVIEHFLMAGGVKLGYAPGELPKLYPKLEVLRYAEEDAHPDFAQKQPGRVVRFLARKPR